MATRCELAGEPREHPGGSYDEGVPGKFSSASRSGTSTSASNFSGSGSVTGLTPRRESLPRHALLEHAQQPVRAGSGIRRREPHASPSARSAPA